MGVKITPADAAFAKCVKERAGWRVSDAAKSIQKATEGRIAATG